MSAALRQRLDEAFDEFDRITDLAIAASFLLAFGLCADIALGKSIVRGE